jgi:hypothetical protein
MVTFAKQKGVYVYAFLYTLALFIFRCKVRESDAKYLLINLQIKCTMYIVHCTI